MKKTFRIGDLVRYYDEFENGQIIGTIIGWSESSNGQRAKVHWFDWFETGPTQTVEYFSEIQLISGERK